MDKIWLQVKVTAEEVKSKDIKYLRVKLPGPVLVVAGQHFEIKTIGANISRKYSMINPGGVVEELEFGVQLKEGGVVSPKVWDLKVGDLLEISGPLGTSFLYGENDIAEQKNIILLGAGSGVTPLLSIYQTVNKRFSGEDGVETKFIMSVKTPEHLFAPDEIRENIITKFTQTEGRINQDFLENVIGDNFPISDSLCYICGPDNFIDDMVDYMVDMGVSEENVKSERFI